MMAPPRLVLLLGLLDLAVSPPSPDYSRDPVRHPPHPSRRRAVEWKKINILHLTDVHSFIAGNRHEGIDTDYGDLVSFVHHMHQRAAERGVDLFVVNTGDIVDGTGMSDATPIAGEFLTPILQRIPYDGFTIGNHELYEDSTVENLRRPGGFLEHFGAVVVTSNQLDASRQPMGVRFNVLRGANGGTLLVFGFLFDWDGFCPNECFVQDVGLAVAEPWFVEAVRAHAAEADGVMVMAHMGWSDPAIETIRAAVRGALDGGGGGGGATAAADPLPLVFLAGHTHIRRFARLDDHAAVLESGRYFDTIGLLSFDAAAANDDTATAKGVAALGRGHGGGAPAITWFEYQYLATTLADFHAASGTDAVRTCRNHASTRAHATHITHGSLAADGGWRSCAGVLPDVRGTRGKPPPPPPPPARACQVFRLANRGCARGGWGEEGGDP
jgi:2',3'-cyclic-nucleotide 2'-phosphodiesterase (5'-nucleotidase family)